VTLAQHFYDQTAVNYLPPGTTARQGADRDEC